MIGIVIGIAVIVAAVCFFVFAPADVNPLKGANNTPESVIEAEYRAMAAGDVDAYLACMAPGVTDYIYEATNTDPDYAKSTYESYFEYIDDISLVDCDLAPVTGSALENLREEWDDRIPGYGDRIQEALSGEVTYNASFSDDYGFYGDGVQSDYSSDVVLLKIDGTWYDSTIINPNL